MSCLDFLSLQRHPNAPSHNLICFKFPKPTNPVGRDIAFTDARVNGVLVAETIQRLCRRSNHDMRTVVGSRLSALGLL